MAGYEVLGSQTPDNLIAGTEVNILTKGVTLLAGQGTLARGSVIGLIALAVGAIAAGESNTGDAAIADAVLAANTQIGAYTITCVSAPSEASADDATFAVFAPDGSRLADATQAVAYAGGHLAFTVSGATSTDTVVGDTFTISVVAGSGKGKLCVSTAVDGSQVAKYLLPMEVNTADGDVNVACWQTGIFNRDALIFAGSDTAADHEDELRAAGIFLRDELTNY